VTARKAKNTNRQGANFELQIMHHLAERGYDVLRSSGSRGKIDVVAVGDVHTLWIQAKVSNPLISPAERRAVIGVARRADIAWWRDRLTLANAVPLVSYRIKGQVCFRELLGYGPKEWALWEAPTLANAMCGCGHQYSAHARDTGCWQRTENDMSCGCRDFRFPVKTKPKGTAS
jgi:hypothetical protein